MENATKALLISGGALLLVLLFTVMNYVFSNMSGSASNIYETMSNSEITEFNQKFLVYDGRGTTTDSEGNYVNPLIIQDVVTIVNLAKDNNQSGIQPISVSVIVEGSDWTSIDNDTLNEYLMTYIDKKYSCKVEYATNSALVEKVTINELS